jgi:hypothetical protein
VGIIEIVFELAILGFLIASYWKVYTKPASRGGP